MKKQKKLSKKILKETIQSIKALEGAVMLGDTSNDDAPDIDHIQVYVTTQGGTIVELHIGFDDDGDIRKTFDVYDSPEDMEEQRMVAREEEEEEQEKILLN